MIDREKVRRIRMEIEKRFYPMHESGGFKIGPGMPWLNGATALPRCINFTVYSSRARACELILYRNGAAEPFAVIAFPEAYRIGSVFSMLVFSLDIMDVEYGFRIDGEYHFASGNIFDKTKTLLDPYAKAVSGRNIWGAKPDWKEPFQYRSKIITEMFDWEGDRPLCQRHEDLIIYEMHLRGFTKHPSSGVQASGAYAGLCEKIPHLKSLGVNAVELLPIFEFDEQEIAESTRTDPDGRPLCNYWGYSTISFFAPKAGYASGMKENCQVDELKQMIKTLHANSISVILDVVFNHTAEGNETGRYISFKGLDNKTYYLLTPEGGYRNYSGCGNTLNCNHPVVRTMILNCLRYWTSEYHIDGFRFDLAAILGRDQKGAPMVNPPLLESLAADPMLSDTLLIAEAWDAGGLYQVGSFPAFGKWSEWNGKYRDELRRFLKGDAGFAVEAAKRITGSKDLYDPRTRGEAASINFLTCHDGFTLYDLYAYNQKHNEQNGWKNTDGTDDNFSWNCGAEGETEDQEVLALRRKMIKNAVAVLFCSQGVPMFLAGDEFGNTQFGNNNPYCQDNEISWLDWSLLEKNQDIFRFFQQMIAFRKAHPVLRNSAEPSLNGYAKTSWHGVQPWNFDYSSVNRVVAVLFAGAASKGDKDDFIYLVINAHWEGHHIELPILPRGYRWQIFVDTVLPAGAEIGGEGIRRPDKDLMIGPRTVMIFTT